MECWYRPGTPSQLDIPARISVTLKIQVEPPQRSEELDHILGGKRCSGPRAGRKMRSLCKQACGIGLDRTALGGSLAGELGLYLGRDVNNEWS